MRVDASFTDFVNARSTALLRTAYLLTGDRGHAEDLLQTALLRAARRWAVARRAPDAYVRRILVNLSHDRRRTLFRRPSEAPLPPDPDLLCGADAGLDRVADRDAVVWALAELPVRQRQVVVLRYFEDLSVEQTAELLGCTTGTVKSYASRALARLRELLADQPEEAPYAHR
ncbi:SigE family RNA polymerase sigma factor [Dactylosporangium sp. NPDC048998]|uniref:SigE family RNA polymerase sigma factor n=1 Tax=Dactylosporangium sp. NPDC048998 TaxID=3363976 RepID=UPI00371E52EE